jgi:hypothetical protein
VSLTPEQYQCERCGGIFTKGWSDAEARAEADQDPYGFQTPPPDDPETATICHGCFEEMKAWVEAHGGIENAMVCNCEGDDCPAR